MTLDNATGSTRKEEINKNSVKSLFFYKKRKPIKVARNIFHISATLIKKTTQSTRYKRSSIKCDGIKRPKDGKQLIKTQ